MSTNERPLEPMATDLIGALLDRAVAAVNDGDLEGARELAGRVLKEDATNPDASELLATELAPGELRRLTILVCDLVGSTELSERLHLERYRAVVRTYQRQARSIIEDRYGGYVDHVMGDGLFSLFGYPTPHEDDPVRAVQAALEVCEAMGDLSAVIEAEASKKVSVRAAVHRGLVFIDSDTGEVYGLAANVAARLEGTGLPGQVVVSEEIRRLVADRFATSSAGLHVVRGLAEPLATFHVEGARPGSDRARRQAPLVGRTHELEVLRGAWRAAQEGSRNASVAVLLTGEPGVGKSRLAGVLAEEVRASGGVVIELLGSSFHVDDGFHPVKRLLQSRCAIAPGTAPSERLARLRAELDGLDLGDDLALLAPVLDLSPEAGYEPARSEGRKLSDDITGAATRYILACLGGGPGMVLAEDVQWFDASTLALLRDLLTGGRLDLVTVATSRPDAPVTAGTRLELGPLPIDQCGDMIDALAGPDLDPATRAALLARCDGIPLYVEELLRGGTMPGDGRPGAVPDVLYEPLVARLYSAAHGVPVAAAAATIGRSVDRSLLERAVDLPATEVDAELRALVEGDVLEPIGHDVFRFRHELLREVAYELQPLAQRRVVHGRVGDLLVERAREPDLVDWSVVASHFSHADRYADGAEAYGRAADRARTRGAIPEARLQLGRAIDLVQRLPHDRDQMHREVDLRLRRGFLAMSAEAVGSADAAADFARCLQLALIDARGDEMFSTLISLWAYHLSRAELDRARQVIETLRSALTGAREYFRAANKAGWGMIQWFEGDFIGALPVLEEAVADLSRDHERDVDAVWFVPNDPTASMHTHLALARFMQGDTAGADEQLRQSAAVTATLAFPQGPWSQCYGDWLGAWVQCERGNHVAAGAAADALTTAAAQHGFDGWALIGMTHRAAIEAVDAVAGGSAAEAGAQAVALGTLVELWQMSELLVFLPFYLTTIAAALATAGDVPAARQRCHEALALAERTGMRFYDAETRRRLALLEDEREVTVAGLHQALEIARGQGARPFELRIALDLDECGAPDGRDALAAAMAAFPADAELADLTRARARLGGT